MKISYINKIIFLTSVLFCVSFSVFAQNDQEEDNLDRYYQMNTFGQNVFLDEEEGIKSYIFYVGTMSDDQYRFFIYLFRKNAVFTIKTTWAKQFIQIETTDQDFKLITPKLNAAKNEVEELWENSSNPLSELEKRMR